VDKVRDEQSPQGQMGSGTWHRARLSLASGWQPSSSLGAAASIHSWSKAVYRLPSRGGATTQGSGGPAREHRRSKDSVAELKERVGALRAKQR
jgi:hypothetical protein